MKNNHASTGETAAKCVSETELTYRLAQSLSLLLRQLVERINNNSCRLPLETLFTNARDAIL